MDLVAHHCHRSLEHCEAMYQTASQQRGKPTIPEGKVDAKKLSRLSHSRGGTNLQDLVSGRKRTGASTRRHPLDEDDGRVADGKGRRLF